MPKTKISKNANGFFETKIDGVAYEFSKWGAGRSLDVLADLAALIGEPMSEIIANVTINGVNKAEISELQMASLVRMLFQAIKTNKTMLMETIEELVAGPGVFADGKEFPKFVTFDDHYTDLAHMFKVVAAALEVQYGAFFAAMGTGGGVELLRSLRPVPKTTNPGATPTT